MLKDADPEIIIIGGHVTRGDGEGGTAKTLPPHNEGELLQAANAVGTFFIISETNALDSIDDFDFSRHGRSDRLPSGLDSEHDNDNRRKHSRK